MLDELQNRVKLEAKEKTYLKRVHKLVVHTSYYKGRCGSSKFSREEMVTLFVQAE